jgi:hypothetical protein
MHYLLGTIFFAAALYVIGSAIVRLIKEWRSLHFVMSRTINLRDSIADKPERSLWLESFKQAAASNADIINILGATAALAVCGIGYAIAGGTGAIVACVLAVAVAFWKVS